MDVVLVKQCKYGWEVEYDESGLPRKKSICNNVNTDESIAFAIGKEIAERKRPCKLIIKRFGCAEEVCIYENL